MTKCCNISHEGSNLVLSYTLSSLVSLLLLFHVSLFFLVLIATGRIYVRKCKNYIRAIAFYWII